MNNIVTMEGGAFRVPDLPEGKEPIFLHLSEGWALGADRQQWMICRKKTRKGETIWNPESFIGGKLAVLRRVIAEKGITLTPAATSALAAFPDSFRAWLAEQERQKAA